MSPRSSKQFAEIRETKKKRIMDTALEMFANEGYHSASISKIAQKAGISKGLMYNYFASKESLLTDIIGNGIEEMVKAFDPNKDGILTDEEFVFFIDELFRIIDANRRHWKLYFAVFTQPDVYEVIKLKYAELIPVFMGPLMGFFNRKGYEDPETEALFFGLILDGFGFNYIINPEFFPFDKIKQRIINMYLKN